MLIRSAAAQSYGLLVTTPIVVSNNGSAGGVYFSRPGADPSIAVTPKTSTDPETVHVLWWVQSEFNPGGNDALWYNSQGIGAWAAPSLYITEARKPRLAVGPLGHLHATFLSYRANRRYDADYVERLPGEPPPLPPPHNNPNSLVFPTDSDNDDLGLAVSTKDGQEQGHVVWSEYSGQPLPAIYYGRAHRNPVNFEVIGDSFGFVGPQSCIDDNVGCYFGYAPAVATLNNGQELHMVWEGQERFFPNNPTIYWGYRRLNCASGGTCSWSQPQPISSNFVAKQAKTSQAACQAPTSDPSLKALLPSLAISPRAPYSLHAIWLQQKATNGPYYVHTARLVTPQNGDPCWDHYQTIDYAPVPYTVDYPTERPRLAFDNTGRRYAVWNVGLQSIVVSTSDFVRRQDGYDVYAPWTQPTPLSTGVCHSPYGVRGMDLATLRTDAPSFSTQFQFIHVVWSAVEQAGQLEGRICYSRLAYGYQMFAPHIDKGSQGLP